MSRKTALGWGRLAALALTAAALILVNIGYARVGATTTVTGPSELLRFHVVANSDSAADQAVKLQVRDAVLALLAPHLSGARSRPEAEAWIRGHLADIRRTADAVLRAAGRPYAARVDLGLADFPTKTYGSFVFPAGRYDALDIFLGKAQGQNWWCVVFPQICLVSPQNSLTASEPASPSPKPPPQASGKIRATVSRPRIRFYVPILLREILDAFGIR